MLKIKQTITFLAIVLIVSVGITISLKTPSYAAECGGVETSIIDCDQTGCKNNEPTDADGKCLDGSEPDLENTGLWGLLMLVINILTAYWYRGGWWNYLWLNTLHHLWRKCRSGQKSSTNY